MKSQHLATTLLLLCAAATADSPAPIRPHLHFSAGRASQRGISPNALKMDSALAEVVQHMKATSVQPSAAELLLLNPAAKFIQRASDATPLVSIDAITRDDPQQLKRQLVQLGLQKPAVYSNDVGGWLPVSQIEAATALTELHSIRAAMSRTRSGVVTTQGDFAQHSSALRTTYPTLTGAGITVGVLSDSYNCYAIYAKNNLPASGYAGYASNGFTATATDDVSSGDLPSGVNVVQEAPGPCTDYGAPSRLPFGDEGRAMMQIVHDVAPSAGLSFYTAENSEADFAAGIGALQAAGAKVIVDDVGYFDEPFFQDGQIAQAIDAVAAKGVAYFSAAGNEGTNAYDNTSPSFATLSNSAPTTGQYLLNFDNSGATNTTSMSVDIPALHPGWLVAVVLEWDQPYVTGAPGSPGASSHLNLCVSSTGSDPIIGSSGSSACTGANASGQDPVQVLIINNPANATGPTAPETVQITVGLADGTSPPGRLKLAVEGDGLNVVMHSNYAKNATLQGHPNAAGAAAVGAAAFYKTPGCGVTTAELEGFSSQGGTPILFDKTGTRLQAPITRQKPDFVAPDGGNDTFLGYRDTGDTSSVSQCANNASYPNFFGTSAAAPHAAAIAALLLQADSALTPTQIYGAMQSSAFPMATPSPDVNTGYGFIQADATFSALMLSAPPAQAASNPPAASTGGGGGGGAIDGVVLCMLGGLGFARLLQQRRTFGGAHHHRAGDLVVPGLMVVVDCNPDKSKSHDRQG
jgi:hypothetical protein